jgi:Na+/melibiose symporter-like transporter
MLSRLRLMTGISVLWLALSMVFDPINTLLLPAQTLTFADESNQATVLGLMTFVGILLAMVLQPVAGVFSDRQQGKWGRRGTIMVGVVLMLASLSAFGFSRTLLMIFISYLFIQVALSITQAAQQSFIPDLVPKQLRGTASGFKGFMDLGGALLGFILLGQFLREDQVDLALLAISAVLVVTFLLTLGLVREPHRDRSEAPHTINLADAFHLDFREHRPFVWVVVSRFLFLLGTYMVGRFLLYFVAHRLNLDAQIAAERAGSLMFLLTLITAVGRW